MQCVYSSFQFVMISAIVREFHQFSNSYSYNFICAKYFYQYIQILQLLSPWHKKVRCHQIKLRKSHIAVSSVWLEFLPWILWSNYGISFLPMYISLLFRSYIYIYIYMCVCVCVCVCVCRGWGDWLWLMSHLNMHFSCSYFSNIIKPILWILDICIY